MKTTQNFNLQYHEEEARNTSLREINRYNPNKQIARGYTQTQRQNISHPQHRVRLEQRRIAQCLRRLLPPHQQCNFNSQQASVRSEQQRHQQLAS